MVVVVQAIEAGLMPSDAMLVVSHDGHHQEVINMVRGPTPNSRPPHPPMSHRRHRAHALRPAIHYPPFHLTSHPRPTLRPPTRWRAGVVGGGDGVQVREVTFMRVKQLYHPFACDDHKDTFPGDEPGPDCGFCCACYHCGCALVRVISMLSDSRTIVVRPPGPTVFCRTLIPAGMSWWRPNHLQCNTPGALFRSPSLADL